MAATFEDFIQSPQFTFFIGAERKSIVVHAAAIAATSQQLDALINGGMEESEKQCAVIEDVQVDDFVRFCEYAYRGDYTVPPCTRDLSENNKVEDDWFGMPSGKKKKGKKGRVDLPPPANVVEPVPVEPVFDVPVEESEYQRYKVVPWGEPAPIPKPPSHLRSRTDFRALFNRQTYVQDGGPNALILQHFESKPNSAADQNFTPVLLAHARLYCFAHLRLIAPLKALTLQKLHKTLMGFKLYTQRIVDVIELARCAYSSPDLPGRSDAGTLDDLRKLVVEYIVCEIDTIGNSDAFVKYMEEGGEFVGDFWRITREFVA